MISYNWGGTTRRSNDANTGGSDSRFTNVRHTATSSLSHCWQQTDRKRNLMVDIDMRRRLYEVRGDKTQHTTQFCEFEIKTAVRKCIQHHGSQVLTTMGKTGTSAHLHTGTSLTNDTHLEESTSSRINHWFLRNCIHFHKWQLTNTGSKQYENSPSESFLKNAASTGEHNHTDYYSRHQLFPCFTKMQLPQKNLAMSKRKRLAPPMTEDHAVLKSHSVHHANRWANRLSTKTT